jgi:transposase-like protein
LAVRPGPVCPHAGVTEGHVTKLEGKHRPGLYQCNECREQLTVTVRPYSSAAKFCSRSGLPPCLSHGLEKRVSAHQIHRSLGISYKSAWFIMHRVREALLNGRLAPMGGADGIVEVDETVIDKLEGAPKEPVSELRPG